MTQQWPFIEVVCSHGAPGRSHPCAVDGFKVRDGAWVSIKPQKHRRTLRGDEPWKWEFTDPGTAYVPLRDVHHLPCDDCPRQVERRDEHLQEELYLLARAGITAVELDVLGRLNKKVLIMINRLGLTDLTLKLIADLDRRECDSLDPDLPDFN